MVLHIVYYDKKDDRILVHDSIQFKILSNTSDKANKVKSKNFTKNFNILFTDFDIKAKLTIEKSINHHIKECLHSVLNDNKQNYLKYYLYDDLLFLKRICKFPVTRYVEQLKEAISVFENMYPNECGRTLSNYKPKEIEEILKQDSNLKTKEKIYVWLCTNDRFKL